MIYFKFTDSFFSHASVCCWAYLANFVGSSLISNHSALFGYVLWNFKLSETEMCTVGKCAQPWKTLDMDSAQIHLSRGSPPMVSCCVSHCTVSLELGQLTVWILVCFLLWLLLSGFLCYISSCFSALDFSMWHFYPVCLWMSPTSFPVAVGVGGAFVPKSHKVKILTLFTYSF